MSARFHVGALLVFALISSIANAQYRVNLNYIQPTGDLSYFFKPTLGAEVGLIMGEIDDQFWVDVHGGFYSLQPHQKTFPTYALQYGGSNGLFFLPGYDSWDWYYVLCGGIGANYKVIDRKLSPIVGVDFTAMIGTYQHTQYIQTLIMLDETTSNLTLAIRPKIGVSYEASDRIRLQLGVAQSTGKTLEVDGIQTFWFPYLSFQVF